MAAPLPNLAALGEPRPGGPWRGLLGLDQVDGGDALLGLIQDFTIDGDGITELCKKVSAWCLAAGRGSSMCADPNDVQWLNFCWHLGWPKPTTPQTRPAPPTVEGAQLTWKQTFYALCKALNTVRGTFRDAWGQHLGRNWYLRMVREQRKPRADQSLALLERAVFEWSLNPGPEGRGGREVPPPVMRACARAWFAAHPAWALDAFDVNAKRAFYASLDDRLKAHVEGGEAERLRAVVELGADIEVLTSRITPILQHAMDACFRPDIIDGVNAGSREAAFQMVKAVLALGVEVNLQNPWMRQQTPLMYTLTNARGFLDEMRPIGDLTLLGLDAGAVLHLDPQKAARMRMRDVAERIAGLILDRPDFRSDPTELLLVAAIEIESLELVRRLLAHPGVVVARDDPALGWAVRIPDPASKTAVLTLLLQDGRIHPAAESRRGSRLEMPLPPLFHVVVHSSVAVLREMLEHARHPLDLDAQYQATRLLVLAAGMGPPWLPLGADCAGMVAFLLDKGMSAASRAALRAAQRDRVAVLFRSIDELPSNAAGTIDWRGRDFGDAARRVYGDAINTKHDRGDTVLHRAAKRGYARVVEQILRTGVDVTLRNSAGRTALEEARRRANASGSMMRNLARAALAQMDLIIRALVRAAPDYDPNELF